MESVRSKVKVIIAYHTSANHSNRSACGPQSLTFIVDLAVSVNVSFSDHLIHLLVCQLLSQVGHDMTQLCSADVAVTVLWTDAWLATVQTPVTFTNNNQPASLQNKMNSTHLCKEPKFNKECIDVMKVLSSFRIPLHAYTDTHEGTSIFWPNKSKLKSWAASIPHVTI